MNGARISMAAWSGAARRSARCIGSSFSLLREWRRLRQQGEPEQAAGLFPSLLLTVNAIASGLGATG
jgi:hypothetical protein